MDVVSEADAPSRATLPRIEVNNDGIPNDLRQLNQWVLWRIEPNEKGRPLKVPYQPNGRYKAAVNKPQSWGPYQLAALMHVTHDGTAGIGFMFAKGGGMVGIDLDGCRDLETGEIADWAKPILARFTGTYAEISPSGTGIKIFVRGTLPTHLTGKKEALPGDHCGIEAYQHGRYFCVTGVRVDGHADQVTNCQDGITEVWSTILRLESERKGRKKQACPSKGKSNRQTRDRASASKPLDVKNRARKYIAKMGPAIEGSGGDDHTFDVALALVKGFSLDKDEAFALLGEWNKSCDPPWDEERLRRKMDEAAKATEVGSGYLLENDRERNQAESTRQVPSDGSDANASNSPTHEADPIRRLPEVILPGGSTTITRSARLLGQLMADTRYFYARGGVPMRAVYGDDELKLVPMRPAAACSDFESVAELYTIKMVEGEETTAPSICSESKAKQIIEAAVFRDSLPKIVVLSRCPVLIERGGDLVTVCGYDSESGIWASGEPPPDLTLDEARQLLNELLEDFQFATHGDRSRALAGVITPALVFGDLLGGRAPIDVGEADDSQTGKGYRNKLTTAVYRSKARTITQRDRGVGSLQETFDAAVVSAACFISFDNLRGLLSCPALESYMTEPRYCARIPYSPVVEVDATKTIILLTTNKGELTKDLANRSSIVRIRKHAEGYLYRTYPEGDLLSHVEANQPRFLGAVFAVVREWHRLGKPTIPQSGHDFKRWAAVLGWIVECVLGAGPLVEGHREAQSRMASPVLNWMRDVALAVKAVGRGETWMRAHSLLTIILDAGIETVGVPETLDIDSSTEFLNGSRAVGRLLAKSLKGEKITIDDVEIQRRHASDAEGRSTTEYAFFFGNPEYPESPRIATPNQNGRFPNTPNGSATFCRREGTSNSVHQFEQTDNDPAHTETPAGIPGIRGTANSFGEILANEVPERPDSLAACNHIDPTSWQVRLGQAFCPGCGKYMGRTCQSSSEEFN